MAPARPWHRVAIVGLGIAQAAAILVGAVLLIRQGSPQLQVARGVPPRTVPPTLVPAVARVEVDIDYGRTVFIQSDSRGVTVVPNEPEENSNSVDWKFATLGYFEAMAE
jgi:hypothetical protein